MTTTKPIYNKVLIIGATSGIGLSLATRLVTQGTKVIVTGRRQTPLKDFVSKHGVENASAYPLDVLDLPSIPRVAKTITTTHPDLDCVVINAGIQRPFDFTKPATVDFNAMQDEITTNYTAAVHTTLAFLDHLQTLKTHETHIIYMSATLGLAPTMLRTANYNATKAALHQFILAHRESLKRAGSNIQLVEIFPPAVQTELHDARHQPDLKDGGSIGMPLEAFTDGVMEGLKSGRQEFAVGPGQALLDGFEAERQRVFLDQIDVVEGMLAKFKN